MLVMDQLIEENFSIYNGDCVEVARGISDNSIGYSIFSPPFAELYVYNNSERDMGNSKNYNEFWIHFEFLIKELYRIIKPGRSVSFHCMDIPAMKERDGYMGVKDFSGDLIRAFQKEGFIYHSKAIIWKDPLIEATRTKALGLMHKQLVKDSYISRQGIPDQFITMRKPGNNQQEDFIGHPDGLTEYYGSQPPINDGTIKNSHLIWQKYASPVWMDIRQSNTLNKINARDEKDEKHICPLQLDVIARGVTLWSNPNDIVFSPFTGIGSEGYQAVKMNRRFIGIELKESYYYQSILNLKAANELKGQMRLF
jgi:DNA modification methylase